MKCLKERVVRFTTEHEIPYLGMLFYMDDQDDIEEDEEEDTEEDEEEDTEGSILNERIRVIRERQEKLQEWFDACDRARASGKDFDEDEYMKWATEDSKLSREMSEVIELFP